ncbi:hypothetical protein I4U23_005472 [Adineta vaga]|nr:hypothetical protein I4U23_005472 [Adineta vaga]
MMFLFSSLDNLVTDQPPFSSEIGLYVDLKNIYDLPQDTTIDIELLEKIYRSATIQEIYIIYIADPKFNENTKSKQRLAAVIISQEKEATVLKELETTSKLKQLHHYQLPWIVMIERESLRIVKESRFTLTEDVNREIIENNYRIKIMNILLANENFYNENVDICANTTQQKELVQSCLLIETDKILDPAVKPFVGINSKKNSHDIFLTGSTDFLGPYLLDELLRRTDANIYCLVRSTTSVDTSQPRVFYVCGDLTLPQLGLDDHQYSMLVSKIRSIYHCEAATNFYKPYNEHRSANVLGTIEVIKLACLANCRVNYISSLNVLDSSDHSNGYVQSKQVAECLLKQASERGLFVTTIRRGYISWSLSTGDFNKTDWLTILLLDLIKFGIAPETDFTFNITPVDCISRSIAELGESEKTIKATIDLRETHTVSFKSIWTEICRQRGLDPHYLHVTEWSQRLDKVLKTNSQLLHGLQLFSNSLTDSFSIDTAPTVGTESDLNLPIFVEKFLQNCLLLSSDLEK